MATILHVTTCYAGGVSRAIETAVRLVPGHEHHILWAGNEVPDGILYGSVESFPKRAWNYVSAMNKAIVRTSPDIIHAHSSWAGVVSRLASRGSAKLAYEPHCYKFDDPDAGRFLGAAFRGVEKALAGRADVTVVLSAHEDRLARSLSPSNLTHYVPNAPYISKASHIGATVGKREVAMVGRIASQKGPDFFGRVCQLVQQKDPSISFKWIGDGDDVQKETLVRTGVNVTGWLDREALAANLRTTGLYLHSAKYEGFPLSVLDAAAVGLPIVARRIAAIEDTLLWQVETVEEASKAVLLVFSDSEVRSRALHGGEALLAVMNEDSQAEALSNLYSDLQKNDLRAVGLA